MRLLIPKHDKIVAAYRIHFKTRKFGKFGPLKFTIHTKGKNKRLSVGIRAQKL